MGMSQRALAEKSGLKRSTISGIERGERNPSLGVIEKIAESLDVSLAELFVRI